jgi:rSAM/selenodomain-associated transferase 1
MRATDLQGDDRLAGPARVGKLSSVPSSPVPTVSAAVRVIVFAKEPVRGRVKTRLAPALGADEAAALHRTLTDGTLTVATGAAPGAVELCCTPDDPHPVLTELAHRHGAHLAVQGPGHLGERMARAFARTLPGGRPVLIVGTDCPVLSAAYLRQASDALADGADAVLGPAEDGGYVLIGLRRFAAGLFDGITWGGADVCDTQRHRLAELGFRWTELPTLWDVDRPADLARYQTLPHES